MGKCFFCVSLEQPTNANEEEDQLGNVEEVNLVNSEYYAFY